MKISSPLIIPQVASGPCAGKYHAVSSYPQWSSTANLCLSTWLAARRPPTHSLVPESTHDLIVLSSFRDRLIHLFIFSLVTGTVYNFSNEYWVSGDSVVYNDNLMVVVLLLSFCSQNTGPWRLRIVTI